MNTIKVNVYKILSDSIETGINRGYRRAFKHTNDPNEDDFKSEIHNAIMLEISENFIFNEEKNM